MNYLWAGMILIGILYGAFTGNMQAVTDSVLDSAKEAVTLCITMTGILSMWTGMMNIAKEAGMLRQLARVLRPFVRFLFPHIPENHPVQESITTNIIANILGLGWAATPAGLKAMEGLSELEQERRDQKRRGQKHKEQEYRKGSNRRKDMEQRLGAERPQVLSASNEMCTFLVLNISSLQLIPVNIIAYRSQYGSANPTAVVGPGIVATAVSTIVAILFCKIMCRKSL